jgi:hypothetical protein
MGHRRVLDMKTYWLTHRQSQYDFDFDFDFDQSVFSVAPTRAETNSHPTKGTEDTSPRSAVQVTVIVKLWIIASVSVKEIVH